jgi:TRAP transporter TAXI family solute receptor
MTEEPKQVDGRKAGLNRTLALFTETFGLSRGAAITAVVVAVAAFGFAVYWFIHSAPPKTLTITSGPPGSSFMVNAEKYRDAIATLSNHRVTLKILPSGGSAENLQRLEDPRERVDVGFVQGGVTNALVNGVSIGPEGSKLESLGSISYQPLLVFYRGDGGVKLISEFKGRRLAVGPPGSGTRALAMTLLALNGIEEKNGTTFLDLDATEAAAGLTNGTVDAAFLMGDSASPQMMKQLLVTPGIHILDFNQADGYTRRITYLNPLEIPMGAIDFGKNIPAQDLHLIGPTVELLARPDLHPALVDLLLEAAQQVHGGASLMKHKAEFPAALEHDFPISDEAGRFYKSGKKFLYQKLPFWLASLANRVLVAFVPMVVLLIPALRAIPALFKWRVRLIMYRRYRGLITLERELDGLSPEQQRDELLARLDSIESAVNKMKVPASFAEQFYNMRGHIGFVRRRLLEGGGGPH